MIKMNNYYMVDEMVKFGKSVKFYEHKKYGEDDSHVVTINNTFFDYCDDNHVDFMIDNEDRIRLF